MIKPKGCPGGCLVELCIQLTLIMIGKQIKSTIKEYSLPKLAAFYKKYQREKTSKKPAATKNNKDRLLSRLLSDYELADAGPRPMFGEYLEMLIQFGFMTIFIPAFPLAPFFALINNIFEIRTDAMKFVKHIRRPVAERVENIGIWLSILTVVSRIAVKSNAILIAFGTTYIETFVYRYRYSTADLEGFIKFTLSSMLSSSFNVTTVESRSLNETCMANGSYCNYFGFRYPPNEKVGKPFSFSPEYWEILAFKLAFVYLFEHFVLLVMTIISVAVPDIPDEVRMAIKLENSKTNKIIEKVSKMR